LAVLMTLKTIFRLKNSDFERSGFSKAYISGILSGKVEASSRFWIKMNAILPSIILDIGSACCVFEIPKAGEVDVGKIEGLKVVGELKKAS
jgi:hypothetical protein